MTDTMARDEMAAEMERLRLVNRSTSSYAQLLEGALLAAWKAGESQREALMARDEADLDDEERKQRLAWEVAREFVIRIPEER